MLTVNLTAEEFALLTGATKRDINHTEADTKTRIPIAEWRSHALDLQRNHWRKLHTTRFTAYQLEQWIQSIPGCASCQRDFRRIVADHPPIFDDWERWTWIVHNVVNTKLGKQLIAWTDAITLWDWPIKDIPINGSTENTGDSQA